jgi:hypothetical protein
MGNAIKYPVGTIATKVQQDISHHTADWIAHELNANRQNNKYIPEASKTGNFANLEDAITYKEWLVNNGPNNKESKYYYYETVEVKHRHKIGPFWDNPTYSYHQELRFNHDSYNRDLHNAEETIQSCKQQIYQEGIRFEQIITTR